jgi:hypothetical protein
LDQAPSQIELEKSVQDELLARASDAFSEYLRDIESVLVSLSQYFFNALTNPVYNISSSIGCVLAKFSQLSNLWSPTDRIYEL